MSADNTVIISIVVTKEAKDTFERNWKAILDYARKNGFRKPLKGVYLEKVMSESPVTNMTAEAYLNSIK